MVAKGACYPPHARSTRDKITVSRLPGLFTVRGDLMLCSNSSFDRRTFLGGTATAIAAWGTARLTLVAAELPKDLRITRIVAFDLPLKRSKIAGRNARLDVHG